MQTTLRFRRLVSTLLLTTATAALLLSPSQQAQAQSNAWAEKMFDKTKHDFGVVARGADVQYRFKIKNLYKEKVHISDVRTTCGCSAAEPTKKSLATYETAEVIITMDTRRFSRRKDTNLIVTFDQPIYAQVRIPITAYIRTDVVLSPGTVNFGAVEKGKPAKQSVKIEYAGRGNWKIRNLKIASKYLTGRVVEKSRVGGQVNYELSMTLKNNAPVGTLREQVILVTDDANSPFVPVPVLARVESDITVTAPSLAVTAGQPKIFNLVIRGRKPFKIEKIDCPKVPDCFQAKVADKTRPVHVVPVTFTPPKNRTGAFRETLHITIAGRSEPVEVSISGRIASN